MTATVTTALSTALERLYRRDLHTIKLGLETQRHFLEALGNPQKSFRVIHVAGTNGKGSVCAIMASVLAAAGYKTGLYTSPHLVLFNERIRINGLAIEDRELLEIMDHVDEHAEVAAQLPDGRDPTFFEYTTTLAFQHFKEKGVEIAVVETGMGGRLDATNVVDPMLSVITPIGLEHTQYLGTTIQQIAGEKCGIIKQGRPVLCGELCAEALDVVRQTSKERSAPLMLARDMVRVTRMDTSWSGQKIRLETENVSYRPAVLPLVGKHQMENCATAVGALQFLDEVGAITLEEGAVKKGIEKVTWPARFQLLSQEPIVILDAAHNPDGARVLLKALEDVGSSGRALALVGGFASDKDAVGFLNVLKNRLKKCWLVEIDNERAMPLDDAMAAASAAGVDATASTLHNAVRDALEWAATGDRIVCIAGSLYLAGAVLDDLAGLGLAVRG